MLFWQKAFKSIAYGNFQSARLFFVSEMKMAKQCQLNQMMVLASRHEEIWLGTKVADPKISHMYICVCTWTCRLFLKLLL